MGRPCKNNAEYFSHDSGMRNDVKIKALRKRFSHTGYAVWNYLLESLTDSANFRIRWDEIAVDLYSADFDVTPEELAEIVAYCVKIDLLQMEDGYLCSENLRERFNGLVRKRKKEIPPSDAEPDEEGEEACGFPRVSDNKTSGNSPETSGNDSFREYPRAKSKVKYSIEKKSKEYCSSSAHAREEVPEEEKKEFFKVFFFRNIRDPDRELERFLAWNARRNNVPTVHDAELWEATNPEKKYPDRFLNAWKNIYNLALRSGPDGESAASKMIDSRVRFEMIAGAWTLTCPSEVAKWIESHVKEAVECGLKQALRGYRLNYQVWTQ